MKLCYHSIGTVENKHSVKRRRQGRRKRGKKITRYKYSKGKRSQKEEEGLRGEEEGEGRGRKGGR